MDKRRIYSQAPLIDRIIRATVFLASGVLIYVPRDILTQISD